MKWCISKRITLINNTNIGVVVGGGGGGGGVGFEMFNELRKKRRIFVG